MNGVCMNLACMNHYRRHEIAIVTQMACVSTLHIWVYILYMNWWSIGHLYETTKMGTYQDLREWKQSHHRWTTDRIDWFPRWCSIWNKRTWIRSGQKKEKCQKSCIPNNTSCHGPLYKKLQHQHLRHAWHWSNACWMIRPSLSSANSRIVGHLVGMLAGQRSIRPTRHYAMLGAEIAPAAAIITIIWLRCRKRAQLI